MVLTTFLLLSGVLLIYSSLSEGVVSDADAEDLTQVVDYSAVTLEGEQVSLSDLRGETVLINSWATWCHPCREEMPDLQALQDRFADEEFSVIGVSIDDAGSTRNIQNFLQSEDISYTVWHDPDNKFQYVFQTIGVPESALISKDGVILHRWKGVFEPMSQDTISRVDNAINDIKTDADIPKDILGSDVSLIIAFSAGLLSFLSPCVLPLIPIYASFLAGDINTKDLSQRRSSTQQKIRLSIVKRGLLFMFGFSVIFTVFGSVAGYAGSIFLDVSVWIERIGGIILIVLGLHLIGAFKILWLERQLKFDVTRQASGKTGVFFVGMAFGAAWTPCIGPILAGILTIAAASSSVLTGTVLLAIYSSGLAIPFLLSALALDRFMIFFNRIKRRMVWIQRVNGLLLIGIGIILLTGSLSIIVNLFNILP